MIELPVILKTWTDTDGVVVHTVQFSDGRTCDMTVEQYEYLKASADAVSSLEGSFSTSSETVSGDPASSEIVSGAPPSLDVSESPDLRTGEDSFGLEEVPFIGSLTAYDDRAADTPALYSNLPSIDNSFTAIMDWFGDTFFIERTETVHKAGFTSERYSYNSSTQLIQLPYEEDVTTTSQVLNPQACVSAVLVVLVFVTTVTWIKNAIWGRMS